MKTLKTRKILIILIIIVSLLIVALIGFQWYNHMRTKDIVDSVQTTPEPDKEEKQEYVSPIDFASLKAQNSDIYSWIKIPGTCVDFPIVSRAGDNSYYLRRDFTGAFDWNGCIFTENYNSLTFEDKVTVIYGHNIKSGTMFGDLIQYTDREYFNANDSMTIYLPDGQKEYTLVAAVTFDNRHLLHYNDYNDPEQFESLAYQLLNTRNLTTTVADGAVIDKDDRLVILSTCYYNQKDKRFLVIFKED